MIFESSSLWFIWFDVNVFEFINGYFVKDVMLCYFMWVVCFDVDKEVNFWGLVLDCDEIM